MKWQAASIAIVMVALVALAWAMYYTGQRRPPCSHDEAYVWQQVFTITEGEPRESGQWACVDRP